MPQPTPYDRQSSFTLLAQEDPATPYTGADLDAEFNAVKATIDELLANLALIQRDDGDLANQTVGPDQLASSIDIGINPPSAWMTATTYSQYDTAFEGTSLYRATEEHTSGTFATDLANGLWELLADFNVVAIADNSISTVKLQDLAVTTAKINTNAVTTGKIIDDAVTTAKILDANVTVAKLGANSVSTVKVQDAAITADKLASDAVITVKILDANVTLAKLANIAASTILGRTSAGAGVPLALTAAQATAILDAWTGDSGTGGVKGLVNAPAAGDAAAGKFLKANGSWTIPSYIFAPDVIIEDQKTSGTVAGTFTSGADRTRTLNTEVRDALGVCSIASNQFTLAAGTYLIEWDAPAYGVNLHQSFLYDITGAAELKRGSSEYTDAASSTASHSKGSHVVTIAAPNVFEIRHRCQSTSVNIGFGTAASFGTEIFTVVKIWKDRG